MPRETPAHDQHRGQTPASSGKDNREQSAQYLDEVGWVSADHLIVARADLAAFTVDWGERADCRFLARLDSR